MRARHNVCNRVCLPVEVCQTTYLSDRPEADKIHTVSELSSETCDGCKALEYVLLVFLEST